MLTSVMSKFSFSSLRFCFIGVGQSKDHARTDKKLNFQAQTFWSSSTTETRATFKIHGKALAKVWVLMQSLPKDNISVTTHETQKVKWLSQGWFARPVNLILIGSTSHRPTEVHCRAPPPKVSPPLHCDDPPILGEFPKKLCSGRLKLTLLPDILVKPEIAVNVIDAFFPVLEGWLSASDASFFW